MFETKIDYDIKRNELNLTMMICLKDKIYASSIERFYINYQS